MISQVQVCIFLLKFSFRFNIIKQRGVIQMKEFSENLKRIRELRGFSRSYMADRIGVSLPAYSAYENGKEELGDREPSISNIIKIATILGVSVDELLLYKEDKFTRDKVEWIVAGFAINELKDGTIEIIPKDKNKEPREFVFSWSREEFEKLSNKAYTQARSAFLNKYWQNYSESLSQRAIEMLKSHNKGECQNFITIPQPVSGSVVL